MLQQMLGLGFLVALVVVLVHPRQALAQQTSPWMAGAASRSGGLKSPTASAPKRDFLNEKVHVREYVCVRGSGDAKHHDGDTHFLLVSF